MFLSGPFMRMPFLERGSAVTSMRNVSVSTAQFAGTTGWDKMLSDARAPVAYFAELEPWVLTDRS